MAQAVLVGAILASGAYLLLLYSQASALEERLRRLIEATEQRLLDTWREFKYDFPGRPERPRPEAEDEE